MTRSPRRSLSGLTSELFLFVVLPLAVMLLVVTFGGVALHRQAMRQMVGERDARAAAAAALALDEQLAHRLSVLQGLAVQAGSAAPEALETLLRTNQFQAANFEHGLAWFSPQGERLAGADSPAWEALRAGGWPDFLPSGTQLSPVFYTQGQPVMAALAADPSGQVIAVGAFSPARLAEYTLRPLIPPSQTTPDEHGMLDGEIFLVDPLGQVIYHSAPQMQTDTTMLHTPPAQHPGVSEALAGGSGWLYMDDTPEHVAAYSPVPRVGWALVIEEPWESVSSPLLRTTEYAPLVMLPILILSVLALGFAAQRIVAPLQKLQTQAARVGWGDYSALQQPVGGISEIGQLQQELAHLAGKVQAAQQGLRDYIGAMTAGQEEERRRLARELHDDTLQAIIALNQRIQLLRLQLGADCGEPLREQVDALQSLAEASITNLRRLTRALRPIYLEDLGLPTALEMLAGEMSTPELLIAFDTTGEAQRLPPAVELALYRMAQEALNNVVHHAHADRAHLFVHFEPDLVHLKISDNGRGFEVPPSPAAFAPSGHFGLLGLHERAEMIGAVLRIQSKPGEGTLVSVMLTLAE